jgi:ribonuclease VapC
VELARAAFRRYRKRRHAAGLRTLLFVCAGYVEGEPLLFKGDDFPGTDIVAGRRCPHPLTT